MYMNSVMIVLALPYIAMFVITIRLTKWKVVLHKVFDSSFMQQKSNLTTGLTVFLIFDMQFGRVLARQVDYLRIRSISFLLISDSEWLQNEH